HRLRQQQLDEFACIVQIDGAEHDRDQRHQKEHHADEAELRLHRIAAESHQAIGHEHEESDVRDEPPAAHHIASLVAEHLQNGVHAASPIQPRRIIVAIARSSVRWPVMRLSSSSVPTKVARPSSRKATSSASSSSSFMTCEVTSTV